MSVVCLLLRYISKCICTNEEAIQEKYFCVPGEIKRKYLLSKHERRRGLQSPSFVGEDIARTNAQVPSSVISDYFATSGTITECYSCNLIDQIS